MALTPQEIERIYRSGNMPDWVYYQTNGKTPEENLEEQHRKIMERYQARLAEERRQAEEKKRQKELDKEIEAEVEKKISKAIEKALDDLLKGFK